MAALNSEKYKPFNDLEREACASTYSLDLHISRFHYYWIGIHKGAGKVQDTRENVSASTVDTELQRIGWMKLFLSTLCAGCSGYLLSKASPLKGTSKNVGEAVSARQKQAKKALGPHSGLRVVNEHSEPVFNAAMATQVVFRGALKRLPRCGECSCACGRGFRLWHPASLYLLHPCSRSRD